MDHTTSSKAAQADFQIQKRNNMDKIKKERFHSGYSGNTFAFAHFTSGFDVIRKSGKWNQLSS